MTGGGRRCQNSRLSKVLTLGFKGAFFSGTSVAQSVEHPTSAQVMISRFMSQAPYWLLLSAQSPLWSLCPPRSLRAGGGPGRPGAVLGIEAGTFGDEHWVLYGNQFENKFHILKKNKRSKIIVCFSNVFESY